MPRAFHVDRVGQLQPGQKLRPTKPLPLDASSQPDLAVMAHVDAAFPDGLTRFGFDYLIGRRFLTGTEDTGQETDLIFELVRRLSRPDLPSRYTSVFASETLEQAHAFRNDYCGGAGTIVEVEYSGPVHRADHELLDLSGAPVEVWLRAERYWRGQGSDKPAWELLLAPPVRVTGPA